MARRMFSPKVTNTDVFLDMPVSARELYFQLGMNADDDGFITPRKVLRMIGASEDDLKILIAKNFVIPFRSGVIVITAWKINNLVRKDWYQETIYQDEKKQLKTGENGEYSLVNEMLTSSLTQVRLGKVSIEKEIYKEKVTKQKSDLKLTNPEKLYPANTGDTPYLTIFQIAQTLLDTYNKTFGTNSHSFRNWIENLEYWLQEYSPNEIGNAISKMPLAEFYCDIDLEVLLRKFLPNREKVNHIDRLLNDRYRKKLA